MDTDRPLAIPVDSVHGVVTGNRNLRIFHTHRSGIEGDHKRSKSLGRQTGVGGGGSNGKRRGYGIVGGGECF